VSAEAALVLGTPRESGCCGGTTAGDGGCTSRAGDGDGDEALREERGEVAMSRNTRGPPEELAPGELNERPPVRMGDSGSMGMGASTARGEAERGRWGGDGRSMGEPMADGKGGVWRGAGEGGGDVGWEAGRVVGHGLGILQRRAPERWPEAPQSRQRTGSRHTLTRWRGERQRKQQPWMQRREKGGGVTGVGGAAGERRASRYDLPVGSEAAVNGDGAQPSTSRRDRACPHCTGE
jgi:hypothetical protein